MSLKPKTFVLVAFAIAVLLMVVGVTGCADSDAGSGEGASTEPVVVRMFIRGALNQVVESFEAGQEVRVKDTGVLVGTITDVEVVPSKTSVPTSEGELREADSPVFSDVTLTLDAEAVVSEKGYQFNGQYLYVNDEISYLTPTVHFKGMIISMEPAP